MKRKKTGKKVIGLTAAILIIVFIISVIVYQMTTSHKKLTDDLNSVFTNPKK